MNWKVVLALVAIGYALFLAYEAVSARSAVSDAASGVGSQLESIWSGLTASASSLSDAGSDLADTWEVAA